MINFIFFIFIISAISFANDNCKVLIDFDNTNEKKFVMYLNRLVDISTISNEDLLNIKNEFKEGNPTYLLELLAGSSAKNHFHKERIEIFIKKHELDYKVISKLINVSISQINNNKRSKNLGKSPFHPINFIQINSSTKQFRPLFSRNLNDSYSLSVDKNFEIMETPITQYHWYKVMGNTPSEIQLNTTDLLQINNSEMAPNHPVTNITYDQIVGYYASNLHLYETPGSQPAQADSEISTMSKISYDILKRENKYDLSSLKYKEGFLEKINKLSKDNDESIYALIPDHKKFSTYRLPYMTEWQLILDMEGERINPISTTEILKHSRKINYSEYKTIDVKASTPLIFKSKMFFEVMGNSLYEICQGYTSPKFFTNLGNIEKGNLTLTQYKSYLKNYNSKKELKHISSQMIPIKRYDIFKGKIRVPYSSVNDKKDKRVGFRLVRETND